MSANESPDHHVTDVASTERPQSAKDNELVTEARLAAMKASTAALAERIRFSEDPSFFDMLRKRFGSDYNACSHIAQIIGEGVEMSLQGEYYSEVRNILAFHPRAKEMTETMELQGRAVPAPPPLAGAGQRGHPPGQ